MSNDNLEVPELAETGEAYEIRDEYNINEAAWYGKAETWVVVGVLALIVAIVIYTIQKKRATRGAPGVQVEEA